MALVCSLNPCRLCEGCMVCQEPQDDVKEEYNRRVDAAYDKEEDYMQRSILRNIAHENMARAGMAHVNRKEQIKYVKGFAVFKRRGKHSHPVLKRSPFAQNWREFACR